jgi:hypothetical protein
LIGGGGSGKQFARRQSAIFCVFSVSGELLVILSRRPYLVKAGFSYFRFSSLSSIKNSDEYSVPEYKIKERSIKHYCLF